MFFLFAFFFLVGSLALALHLRQRRSRKPITVPKAELSWAEVAAGIFELENPASIEGRMELALRTGARKLEMSHGIICHHRGDTCTILHLHCDGYEQPRTLGKGQVIASRRLFCGELGATRETLVIDIASLSDWRRHSAYQQLGWETYIGSRVVLNDREFLTVGFFQSRPRESLFSRTDKDFVRQLTLWIAAIMQRERASGQRAGSMLPLESSQSAVSNA